MLDELLKDEMRKRGLSTREAAREIGVAHTTVARMMQGITVDIPTLQKTCNWLGIQVSTVLNVEDKSELGLTSKLAMILEKQPELAGVFAEALDELEAGHLSTDDLADIMGYAAYRINLGKKRKES
ncbi:MAG: helix-turn-helix transcriptional regulator [Anaerolineaceae bacterium]